MQSFSLHYGYLIGSLILGVVWVIFYLIRKDLRKEMIWISLIMSWASVTEKFFVPTYWHPGSLFNLINRMGFGIESILFSFFASGIAGVFYEILAKKHLRRGNFKHDKFRAVPLFIFIMLVLAMLYEHISIHLYSLTLPALVVSILIGLYRRDLIKEILYGGLYFSILYLLLFTFFFWLFPTYIHDAYNMKNLWGIYIFGIPFEEILFAFAIGAMLSPMYEYVQGFRMYSYRKAFD